MSSLLFVEYFESSISKRHSSSSSKDLKEKHKKEKKRDGKMNQNKKHVEREKGKEKKKGQSEKAVSISQGYLQDSFSETSGSSYFQEPEDERANFPCSHCFAYKDRIGKLEWALLKIQTTLQNDCNKAPKEMLKDQLLRILHDPWVNLSATSEIRAPFKFQQSLFPDHTQTQESGFEKTRASYEDELSTSQSPENSVSNSTDKSLDSVESEIKYKRLEADFDVLEKLGSGGFGFVLKVRHKLDGKLYAVKEISLAPNETERDKQKNELSILCELNHPHVVRYFSSWFQFTPTNSESSHGNSMTSSHGILFENGSCSISAAKSSSSSWSKSGGASSLAPVAMYIQMELCGSNLREAIDKGLPENPPQIWSYLRQIIGGIEYIHSRGVIHRDLKPGNIFITTCKTIKIGDFGLSTKKFSEFKLENGQEEKEGLTMNLGTSFYIAPEVQSKIKRRVKAVYDHRSDIYSLGIIILEILHSFSTHMERQQVLAQVCQTGEIPRELEVKLRETPTSILKSCLSHTPSDRPSLLDIESNLVICHEASLYLLHPQEGAVNWPGLSSSESRYMKYLRIYEKPADSVILTDRFFSDLTISPIIEYCPQSFLRSKVKSNSRSNSPALFFHFPKKYASAVCLSDQVEEMKRAALLVKKSLNKGQSPPEGADSFLQKIHKALVQEMKTQNPDKNVDLSFPVFLNACQTAYFCCTIIVDHELEEERMCPSKRGESLNIHFDMSKLESKLNDRNLGIHLPVNFQDLLRQSLKQLNFLDSTEHLTPFWLESCAQGSKLFSTPLPNLPHINGLSHGKIMEYLRNYYFNPYFVKFSKLLLKKEMLQGDEIELNLKICAMTSLL